MTVFLTTPRVRLRRFTTDDADLLHALDNDPAVMRYINGGLPVAREEIVDDVIPAFLRWYARHPAYGFWAAEEREGGRFLGWFHYRPGEDGDPRDPELGYRLHEAAWGQGYATEVSRALIDNGFSAHDVERVHAETMVVNVASRRVMEKAGMRLVRTFHADWPVRIDGDEHGDVEYAITRAEWQARQPLRQP
ncbi:GNAT family N-acetyltransferase [Mumia sp. Pv 4-285]|uniref:GNAT family N-acetyltransferase n=1 Tax=Mumia qirimensis TaxID=3234852 RepID=UPI00351CDE7D